MTYAYDLERLRVALATSIKASGDLCCHPLPERLWRRIITYYNEARSLAEVLTEYKKEHQKKEKANENPLH